MQLAANLKIGLSILFMVFIFGGTAMFFQLSGNLDIAAAVQENMTSGLFITLSALPFGKILSGIAILLIITFFVTSADSATFVIAMFSKKGDLNPPGKTKLIWGILLALTAVVLLKTGGLQAMQNASIIFALPFVLVLILICIALYRSLKND